MYGLLDSLRDNVLETFIKIGDCELELNFNYPKRTLAYLLALNGEANAELEGALDAFFADNEELLSGSGYLMKNSDVRIRLSKKAVKALYSGAENYGFLSDLYAATRSHGVTAKKVEEVFLKHKTEAKKEVFDNGDFDVCFSLDTQRDPYIYLFKFENGHCDFHRLLWFDYDEIYKNDN